jgi:hypothetical protein
VFRASNCGRGCCQVQDFAHCWLAFCGGKIPFSRSC